MEGSEKIRLIQPDLSHKSQFGEVVDGFELGAWDVWATRHDQRGREELSASAETLDFSTIFEIRETNRFRQMNETWEIIDQYGDHFNIVGVSRLRRYMGRYRILLLYASRKDV